MSRLLAALAMAAAMAAAGCAGGDGGERRSDAPAQTTRVEVVEEAGRARGPAFDASAIYRRWSPGVVTVISGEAGTFDRSGLGSGFVISGRGEIVTNAHVVTSGGGAAIRRVDRVYVRFKDGNQVDARIVGFDPFSDVALLRIDPEGLTLRPLALGTTAGLAVGEPVAAIGSPFGEEQSLSVGVVSALDRAIRSLTGFATTGAIQTDAAINQGNSGGPLLDARGRVLGVNAQIQTTTGEGSGVGFAVSVDTVRRSLRMLRRDGRVRYAYLGVASTPLYPQLAERFDLPVRDGAWLQEVTPGGPAEEAGLRGGDGEARFQGRMFATGGDVIVAVAGRPVRRETDLAAELARRSPGERISLEIVRDGDRRTVTVRLGARPLDSARAG